MVLPRGTNGLGWCVLSLLFLAVPAFGDSVKLAWNDDANDPNFLQGYRIYYGASPGHYDGMFVEVPVQKFGEVTGLRQGVTYYFAVKAVSIWKEESDPSNEVPYYVRDTVPPAISITSPPVACNVSNAPCSATLSGVASDDNVGVTAVYWRYRGQVGVATGTTSWAVAGIPIVPGDSDIVMTAVDRDGNTAEASLRVNYAPPQPVIGGVEIRQVSSTSAAIYWLTSIPGDSRVDYRTSSGSAFPYYDGTLVRSHTAVLTNLLPGATYSYGLKSQGASGESMIFGDRQFTLKTISQTFSFPRLFIPGLSPRPSGTAGANVSDRLDASDPEYVGIALTNPGPANASLTFTAYSAGGDLISGEAITNPVIAALPAGGQATFDDGTLFNFNGNQSGQFTGGWVRLDTDAPNLSGFFLDYDSRLTQMDGALLTAAPLNSFLFTDIQDKGSTKINIANTGLNAAAIFFDLTQSNGTLRARQQVNVAGWGSLIADLRRDLFPDTPPAASDYVSVWSPSSLAGYELMTEREGKDIAILGGFDPASGGSVLYAPQYVVGGGWSSTLSIVNLTRGSSSVTLEFFDPRGKQIGQTQSRPIISLGKVYIDDQRFFAPAGPDVMFEGYVRITGQGVKLTGSLRLSYSGDSGLTTALPLMAVPSDSLTFGQLASDDEYYTGIAILNPGITDATAVMTVYPSEGEVETASFPIPAGKRLTGALTSLFPNLAGRKIRRGYVRVSATQPVVGYAVFGTEKVLSAIPPQ